jgi:hypothetical protein
MTNAWLLLMGSRLESSNLLMTVKLQSSPIRPRPRGYCQGSCSDSESEVRRSHGVDSIEDDSEAGAGGGAKRPVLSRTEDFGRGGVVVHCECCRARGMGCETGAVGLQFATLRILGNYLLFTSRRSAQNV